jgi:hypothetical protein
MGLLDEALKYWGLGWSIIPLGRDKRPLIPEWSPYQKRRATKDEIEQWWTKWPDANIGIVTGSISGIVVLDADSVEASEHIQKKEMPPTPQVRSGKGTHHYFKHPGGRFPNRVGLVPGLDVRGDGGYVVAPPSIHPTGRQYEWAPFLSPWEVPPDELPPWVLEGCRGNGSGSTGLVKAKNPPGWQYEALRGVSEGQRNQTTAQLAGNYIRRRLSDEEILLLLRGWNQQNRPPLPDGEIVQIVRSVRATHERKNREASPLAFPEVITGLAGDFAQLYSRYLEVPAHFFFMGFLTCLGSVLADRLTLASEVAPQPRLFTLLLGESADDRKSTAISKVTDFFREAAPEAFHLCLGVGSAEGLQEFMRKNGKLLLCFDEFKSFVSKCKIDGSVLLPCVNTLFESNRYESRTKTTDIKLERAFLSLLAASTIRTYENTWSTQFIDIGFNNRLFLVPGGAEKKFSYPLEIPEREKDPLKLRLMELHRHVGGGLKLNMSAEALALYHGWYMNLERSPHAKRLDTYAMRLMSLLSVNDLKREVDEETARKAIALADWQLEVRRLYDPIDAENTIAKMEQKIRRCLRDGPQKEWKLKKAVHYERDGLWAYNTAKTNLERAGELVYDNREERLVLKHR